MVYMFEFSYCMLVQVFYVGDCIGYCLVLVVIGVLCDGVVCSQQWCGVVIGGYWCSMWYVYWFVVVCQYYQVIVLVSWNVQVLWGFLQFVIECVW